MKISRFFEDVLGANLVNARWSWGAVDPIRNIVFLRIWADQIRTVEGRRGVQVYWKKRETSSAGFRERKGHIDAIKAGATAIGVICTAKDPGTTGSRSIKDYQQDPLIKLGMLFEDDSFIYAEFEGEVTLDQLANQQSGESTLATDLRRISNNKKIGTTEKEALISARVGQGQFRANLLLNWGYRCAVTGVATLEVIRASHIKPWRKSANDERLDPDNGVPLIANLDALFDSGLISFDADGKMMVSDSIEVKDRKALNAVVGRLRKKPSAGMKKYLEYHRTEVFRA